MKLLSGIKCLHFLLYITKIVGFPAIQETSEINIISEPQHFPENITQCLSKANTILCIKWRAIDFLEQAINDNKTLHLSDSLVVEKDKNWMPERNVLYNGDSDSILMDKAKELVESRVIRFRIDSKSNGQGRKKDKGFKVGFAIIGAVAILGFIAKMMMGKVAVIAGAALIFSKLALLLSILSSLKKSTGGGSTKDHVIYSEANGSGGGSSHGDYNSGWQRSILPPANNEDYDGTTNPQN